MFLLKILCRGFEKVHNDFQIKLHDAYRKINDSKQMFVSADKSKHIYKMEEDEYSKVLLDNITNTQKKQNAKKLRDIDFGAEKREKNYKQQIESR